jgi:hypothetical protein
VVRIRTRPARWPRSPRPGDLGWSARMRENTAGNTRGPRRRAGTLNPTGTAARSDRGLGTRQGRERPRPRSALLCGESRRMCGPGFILDWTTCLCPSSERTSCQLTSHVVDSCAQASTRRTHALSTARLHLEREPEPASTLCGPFRNRWWTACDSGASWCDHLTNDSANRTPHQAWNRTRNRTRNQAPRRTPDRTPDRWASGFRTPHR